MKTVRVALDESLVQEVDRATQALGTTRSGFTRDALLEALGTFRERRLMRESILEGMATPIEECEEDLDW